MQFGKQHKILAVVVTLGVGAVCLDRFVLSSGATGASSADAASALVSPNLDPAVSSSPSSTPPGRNKVPSDQPATEPGLAADDAFTGHADLSGRLRSVALAEGLDVRAMADAFEPRGDWGEEPKAHQEKTVKSEPFKDRHTLDAIMSVHGEWVALIDGNAVRSGNIYDGHRVVRIESDAVFLEQDGLEIRLVVIDGASSQ